MSRVVPFLATISADGLPERRCGNRDALTNLPLCTFQKLSGGAGGVFLPLLAWRREREKMTDIE